MEEKINEDSDQSSALQYNILCNIDNKFSNDDFGDVIQNNSDNNQLSILTETPYTAQILNPVALQFIPQRSWVDKNVSLQYLEENYFSRKNNITRRFEHKLWNALQITSKFPSMVKLVGVIWVSNTIFKVYKNIFAKLLKIECVEGGLFHKQGNFTRHGFIYVPEEIIRQQVPESQIQDLDMHEVVILYHKNLSFTSKSSEDSINQCKWSNPNGTPRIARIKINEMIPQMASNKL